jgi:hypothetical protein
MSERDVMALLADANPVRAEGVPQASLSVDSILTRRRQPSSRLVLAAAVLLAAVAAGLIGVFAVGGHGAKTGFGRVSGPGALESNNGDWKKIPLSHASSALGAPVVLPSTDLVQPSDAASQAWTVDCSQSSCEVDLSFPAQALGISYTHPAPFADPRAQWDADVKSAGAHHAQAELVDLNGTPGDYVDYHGVKRLVEFVADGTWVVVAGKDYDEATLQSIAQSIVDRSDQSASTHPMIAAPVRPSPHAGSAAAAQATVPFELVLPSRARPLVIVVSPEGSPRRERGVGAFFDTPAAGPFYVNEDLAASDTGEGIRTVADLRQRATSCHSHYLCPVHRIVRVHGVPVLVIGAPGKPGGLTLFWLRGHGRDAVLTWMQGPEDNAHGDLSRHVFRPSAALAVAADMIAHGG